MKLGSLETSLFKRLLGGYVTSEEKKILKKAIQVELEARKRKP